MPSMLVMSKYQEAGRIGRAGWSYHVVAKDDPISALEVQQATLRATLMWGEGNIQGENVDNLTRGVVANLPGLCADGVMREIQRSAYPEAL